MSENTPISPPTTEDLARDAEKDLAVCNAATLGPWHANVESHDINDTTWNIWMCITPYPDDSADAFIFGPQDHHVVTQQSINDFNFIALARTALPTWIRRAVVAEAEVCRLRQKNKELNLRCQQAESVANETVEKCQRAGGSLGRSLANYAANQAQRELEEAKAEIARLRAERDAAVANYRALENESGGAWPDSVVNADADEIEKE